ncbi:unnamed protein product, partial [marine sediment metagenome]
AVETLVTSRYIDACKTFYETAEEYMDELMRLNDRLSAWPSRPESVEPWLLEVQKETKSVIDKFEVILVEHKKAIETTL